MTDKFKSLFIPNNENIPQRRYDLDWLRILAFGLLILYHTGMLYTANWGFHVKSQYLSENLETVMLLVNPWRMPILWIISGIAIRFILAKVSLLRFITQRSYRLLLPLLFAILVIVPPQLYYEMTQQGDLNISYWEFYKIFFEIDNPVFKDYSPGIWHHIDVNHLWYLRELWRFSLYLIFLLPLLNWWRFDAAINWLARRNGYIATTIAMLPILIIQLTIDDTKEPLGFLFLVYGYIIGWHAIIWQWLKQNSTQLLLVSVVCYIVVVLFYNFVWKIEGQEIAPILSVAGAIVYSLDRMVWVLALLGLGYRFLNANSAKLSYFNEAVYPYYILHQTIIVVVGFELTQLGIGPVLEPVLVLIATFTLCAAGFEIIRRVNFLRPLFGLKTTIQYSATSRKIAIGISSILVIGLGLEILI